MDWDSIVLLVLITIGLLICFAILCSLIYSNHHVLEASNKIKPIILNTTYCSIILFIICLGSNLMNFEVIKDLSFISQTIWNNIAVLSWNFAQILVFILLWFRVHHTFHDTVYKVSKWIYTLFVILLLSYFLCCVIWVIHSLILLKIHYKNEPSLLHIYYYLNTAYFIIVEIIDLLISIILITLFISQMIKVTVALRDDLNSDNSTISREATLISSANAIHHQHRASLKLNSQQTKMLDVVTKYSVLSVVATLCTQLNTLIFCVYLIADKLYAGDWEIWAGSVGGIVFCIDCIINPICLYLLFPINRKLYGKLCNKCHLLFGLCLTKSTQKRVKKTYFKASQDQMQMQLYNENEI